MRYGTTNAAARQRLLKAEAKYAALDANAVRKGNEPEQNNEMPSLIESKWHERGSAAAERP